MSEMKSLEDGSFYVEDGTLHQSPRKTKDAEGRTCITLGFPVAKQTEWVAKGELQKVADMLNSHDDLLAALIASERLFEHTWAMNGTIHKQMKAAIAKATKAPA
ncbi:MULTISPECIES: hypothetical protein [unclassified Aureimonas]|uniref:hypothetical protein n=1 Tax=unclassified Aureimonas TaxID=2615206 RepID=UPI00138EF9E6|nr:MULTISPECIES: hypothetical protein [unclassified Aureimonas]